MRLVSRVFQSQRLTAGDIGIEVEVEGDNLPQLGGYWRTEKDGSLRGESYEYVLKQPVLVETVDDVIGKLKHGLRDSQIHDSVRAGVHIHINAQRLNIKQLYSFLTLYFILEDILVSKCGEGRQGNLFCLRASDSLYLMRQLAYVAKHQTFHQLNSDNLRYSAVNVKSLWSYGSVEFRSLRTPQELTEVGDWAKLLLNLRQVACQYESPAQIIQCFSAGESEGFLRNALGHRAEDYMVNGWKDMLKGGMRRTQMLAFCTDWRAYDAPATRFVAGVECLAVDFPNEPLEDV
jgi:hypothetical protein